MIQLNLSSLSNSDIQYETIQFPDGQQDLRIEPLSICRGDGSVEIVSRFTSFKDLELILAATSALRNLEIKDICLNIPYLLGARCDRQFVQGGVSYLKQVVAPIINAQGYRRVRLLDPHSDVAPALINNVHIDSSLPLITMLVDNEACDSFTVVVPDFGAAKRAGKVASAFKSSIVFCEKERDVVSGKILRTVVYCDDFKGNDVVIADDLCDGGKTYIEIGKILKERNCGRIFLAVTHGIFSKGLDPLREYFTKIYCTNSVREIDDPFVVQLKVL